MNQGPGKSFGEVALVKRESFRNASIIADEDLDLLVIGQDLFDRSLKVFLRLKKGFYQQKSGTGTKISKHDDCVEMALIRLKISEQLHFI